MTLAVAAQLSRRKTDKVHALKLNFAPQKNCVVVVVCGGRGPLSSGLMQLRTISFLPSLK